MTDRPGATTRLAGWLGQAGGLQLAPEIAEKAAIQLLDAAGLALAARSEPTAVAARGLISGGGARLWATGDPAAPADAALANGVAVHAHFQDDTDHESWSHPGSIVPPAAVALAEARGIDLPRLLRAIVAGYATMQWLGRGEVLSRALIAGGIRTSPTLGTIGAAAAGAVVLGLDAERARSAVAIAAASSCGTLEPVRCGSDEWRIQNGRAAQGGVQAALFAEAGVTGAAQALEGPKGFLRALTELEAEPDGWASDPDPAILRAVMVKPYATLGDNMPAAMAAEVLRTRLPDPAAITDLSVTLWRPYSDYPGTAFKGPFTSIVQTQASTAFAVSAMLMRGELTYDMGISSRRDDAINRLVQLTRIEPHDGDAFDSTIRATLADGRVLTATAAEAPRTLILPDADRAIAVFEARTYAAGAAAGAGRDLAARLLATARGAGTLTLTGFLDGLRIRGIADA